MNRFILLPILSFLYTLSFAQHTGYVFIDENNDGIKNKKELGMSGVKISDGLNVAISDQTGKFTLDGWEKARFITLYPGANFETERRFIKIEGNSTPFNFPVTLKEKKEKVSFLHISDTETYETKDWYNNLKNYSKTHKPDFIVHTGDICYRAGLDWHAENAMTTDFGVPTYYCLGNHDLIQGNYGEEHFEKNFGPAWYAFEEGNSLFVITPMMRGDYKPGFTYLEIGTWMRNMLNAYPKEMPKYFFNHDLLSQSENFVFKLSDSDSIILNDYNLKGYVYGHWHSNTYMVHGDSGIKSYCVSPAAKGGIDHSPSTIRIINVDENGDSNSQLRWTFVNKVVEIVSPLQGVAHKNSRGKVPILVNTYDSGSEVDSVLYVIYGDKGFNWRSEQSSNKWKKMKPSSDWTWSDEMQPIENNEKYQVTVNVFLHDGTILQDKTNFVIDENKSKKESYNLGWVQNIGANLYMGKPVIAGEILALPTYDNGDASHAFIVGLNKYTGEELWRFKTKNSVNNQLALSGNIVIGTDVQGYTYALNIQSGKLLWEKDLGYHKLAGFVSGIIAENGKVYTGFGKSLVCLNSKTGEEIWRNSEWQGGEGSTPTMEIANNLLIASSNWRAIYAHDKNTGELVWARADDGLRYRDGSIIFKEGLLWVAQDSSGVGMVRALELDSGKTVKSYLTHISNRGTSAPIIGKETIISAGSHPGITSLNRSTGEINWITEVGKSLFHTPQYYSDRQQTIEGTPIKIDNSLVFGAMDGYLYEIDSDTGYINWKVNLGAPVLSTASVVDTGFYITDFAGNVYYFKK